MDQLNNIIVILTKLLFVTKLFQGLKDPPWDER